MTPWLAIQPDVQLLIHPGATRQFGNAFLLGLRATAEF